MSFFPSLRRPLEPAYTHALDETRAVLSATCDRLANCSSSRLPGRAVGSLCELQRATDQLAVTASPSNERRSSRAAAARPTRSCTAAACNAPSGRCRGSPLETPVARALWARTDLLV